VGGGVLAERARAQDHRGAAGALSKIDGSALGPTVLKYDVTLKMRGRSMRLSARRSLRATRTDGVQTWTVVDRTSLPQATVTDSLILNRSTLRPRSHHRSGPVTMRVTYTDTSATGSIRTRGPSTTIEGHFDRPTLAGGTNARLALAALPVGPNFSARLPVFNAQQEATQTLSFEVTGVDTVSTPAGSFNTFVVSMGSSKGTAGGTVHVRQTAPHHVIRSTQEQTGVQGTVRTFVRTLTSLKRAPGDTP